MRLLGSLLVRRAWGVIGVTLAVLAVAGAVGASVESHLSTGGFTDAAWESSRAVAALQSTFGTSEPNIVVLVTARSGSVSDADAAAAGQALAGRLATEQGVVDVSS